MIPPNQLKAKPTYTLHRNKEGSPVGVDTVNLTTLFEEPGNDRASINCGGWTTVRGYVVLEGGTNPTVGLQLLEHIQADNAFPSPAVDPDQGFVDIGTAAGLSSGDTFDVTIDQGRLYLRINALTGNPTDVRVYLAGKERAVSITGQS